ncbi:YceI family protein [bacterium]|nr:YceI family protein [bacterium]
MSRFPKVVAAFAVIALLIPALASAETHTFRVDPVHSQVGFKVRHLVSKVPGHFDEFQGTVTLDPENVAKTLKIEATVQGASVNTNNEKRDGHLQSPDFFDVANHPTITFVSRSAKKVKGELYQVTGDLTMRGVTKSVTLDMEFYGTTPNPFSGMPTTGMDITGKVNRQDFGINWNKTLDAGGLMLSDDVDLEIHIEATVPKG